MGADVGGRDREPLTPRAALQVIAEAGTVMAAYVYFIGWNFFAFALTEIHVSPEDIGISPTWLLTRSLAIGYVLAIVTFPLAIFVWTLLSGTAPPSARKHAWHALGFATFVVVALSVLYALASQIVEWVTDDPLPDLLAELPFDDDATRLWTTLNLSVFWLGLVTAVLLVVFIDVTILDSVRARLREWVSRKLTPTTAGPLGDARVVAVRAETAEADQGRAELSPWMRWFVRGLQRNLDRPRTQYNVLLGFAAVVLLTLLAYTSAQGAGVALGEFLVEGNAVRQKPLLEWPRASTSPIGGAEPKTARCVIVLGRRDGVYAFFVPRDSRVEFAAAETVTVDVPPSHPDCKADAVWEPRAAER